MNWRNISQSTKILIVLLLLVLAVAVWYLVALRPSPSSPVPTALSSPPPTRPITVLPIPFLVAQTPTVPLKVQPSTSAHKTVPVASAPAIQVPPNPFTPLPAVLAAATPAASSSASSSAPSVPSQPTVPPPILPSNTQVGSASSLPLVPNNLSPLPQPRLQEVRQPLPTPSANPLSLGALPLMPQLSPLTQPPAPPPTPQPALASTNPQLEVQLSMAQLNQQIQTQLEPLSQAPQTPSSPPPTSTSPSSTTLPNPVAAYVTAQGLRLAGVVLGPTSVGIFQSRQGYIVLPVGQTFPQSQVLLQSLTSESALLVEGSQSLALKLNSR